MTRLVFLAAISTVSCGKLLGTDEELPPPPTANTLADAGDDGDASADGAADATGSSDGASGNGDGATCKPPLDACGSNEDCCKGFCKTGTCCVDDGQPTTSPLLCCTPAKTLETCSGGGQLGCCPEAV